MGTGGWTAVTPVDGVGSPQTVNLWVSGECGGGVCSHLRCPRMLRGLAGGGFCGEQEQAAGAGPATPLHGPAPEPRWAWLSRLCPEHRPSRVVGSLPQRARGLGLSRERSKGVCALRWPHPRFLSPQFIPLSWRSEGTASPCPEGPRRHATSSLMHLQRPRAPTERPQAAGCPAPVFVMWGSGQHLCAQIQR